MPDFHSPYHFVPTPAGGRTDDLLVNVFKRGVSPHVRHDRYAADAYSGTLTAWVTARTPIFIGARQPSREDRGQGNVEVGGFELDHQPAIPASSLRGLISSVAEAAANSALRVLSKNVQGQPCYSFRKEMRNSLSAIGLIHVQADPETGLKSYTLEPVTLPAMEVDAAGFVRTNTARFRKWRTVFAGQPVFRVYFGQNIFGQNIWAPNFPYRTSLNGRPDHSMAVRPWAWGPDGVQVDRAQFHISAGHHGGPDTLTAQRRFDGPPNPQPLPADGSLPAGHVRGLVRVLGCYEQDQNGDSLRQMPPPSRRYHELFLPFKPGGFPSLPVPPEVVACFKQLAAQMTEDSKREKSPRSYEPKETRPGRAAGHRLELQEGDLVFFDVDNTGVEVTEVSSSSIGRGRVPDGSGGGANAHTFFGTVDADLPPFQPGRTAVTLAEQLFGFVEETKAEDAPGGLALRSRLRFTNALPSGTVIRDPHLTPLRILSSPKPPSPALYFRNRNAASGFIAKRSLNATEHKPQGRKFYLHWSAVDGQQPWEHDPALDGAFDNDQQVKVRLLPTDSSFWFQVHFDNLSPNELGLLLYALNPSPQFQHKLGMGKPLGLGSVKMELRSLSLVERQSRYQPEGFSAPRESEQPPDFASGLRDRFAALVPPTIASALRKLGDPARRKPGVQVSTPRCINPEGRTKTYEWFVANEDRHNNNHQCLKPLDEINEADPLPVLRELPRPHPN